MASSVSAAVPLVVQLLTSVPAEERESLLESCSLAHQSGPCIEPSDASDADTLRASVDFSGSTRVTLEVTDTDPGRSLYASRDLYFEAGDDKEERARAIGLALGVLATTLSMGRTATTEETEKSEPLPPSTPDPTPPDDDSLPVRSGAPSAGSFGLWVAGGATIDPRWGRGAPSGAMGLVGYPHENWGAVLRGQGAWFAADFRSIPMAHLSASLGPSFRIATGSVYFSTALTFGVHRTEARLTELDAEASKGAHTSPVIHAEAGLGWRLSPSVALTVTPTVNWVLSSSKIVVDDAEVGSTATTSISILAGATLFLPSPQTKAQRSP